MKSILFKITIVLLFLATSIASFGQVAINAENSTGDASAILDMHSTSKGFLIPRMTTVERLAINDPIKSLLVYDSDLKTFATFKGGSNQAKNWYLMRSSLLDKDYDTGIHTEVTSADDDQINFELGNVNKIRLVRTSNDTRLEFLTTTSVNTNNLIIGEASATGNTTTGFSDNIILGNNTLSKQVNLEKNVFIGNNIVKDARMRNTIALGEEALGKTNNVSYVTDHSVFIGYQAGYSVQDADQSVFIGYQAGYENSRGYYNFNIGYQAGYQNIDGDENINIGAKAGFKNLNDKNINIGNEAGYSNITGEYNTIIGDYAARSNSTGNYNTVIGYQTAYSHTGDSSIFIGNEAGYSEGNNNQRLYIDNSKTTSPLIYGEMDNDYLQVNGTLELVDYKLPTVDGLSGQGLQLDASGQFVWSNDYSDHSLGLSGNTLHIYPSNSVDLSPFNQTLSISGGNVTLSNGGNTVNTLFADNMGNHSASQNFQLNNKIITYDASSTKGLTISNDGKVGIGIIGTAPARFTVNGYKSKNFANQNSYGRLGDSGGGTSNTDNRSISIWASDEIVAEILFAISDERIKNIQGISNGRTDLEILKQIQISDYLYKDTIQRGNIKQKKVIAQQVAQVFPQAVKRNNTSVIPDIMQSTFIENDWIQLHNHNLKTGERIKVLYKDNIEIVEIIAIEANAIKTKPLPNVDSSQHQIFVYGREVNDFHIVDYDALGMLNVSVTQELFKENQKLSKNNQALQERISTLQQQLQKIEAAITVENGQ